ncbi:MAG: 50S ribosomal protein L22 [bacterium]|nr:50S ribosomal protein L22 [bacterium]
MTATLKYGITSDKKMLLVAKMIQGKSVDEALKVLHFMPKKAAGLLYKVVHSAYANATNNAGLKGTDLYIKTINVGRGPKLKRYRFASRSRVHGYVKHRSFVRVVLQAK